MKIERIEDKKFQITISEKEALRLADVEDMDLEYCKIYGIHVGRILLHYMIGACQFPDMHQPAFDQEL